MFKAKDIASYIFFLDINHLEIFYPADSDSGVGGWRLGGPWLRRDEDGARQGPQHECCGSKCLP